MPSHRHHAPLLLALLALPFSASAASGYAYTATGLFSGKGVALSISNAGNITGSFSPPDHAYLIRRGAFLDLGTLPGSGGSTGHGVNDAGDVAGVAYGPDTTRAFLYKNGNMIDLGVLGAPGAAAAAINNDGLVVGSARVDAYRDVAFLYQDGVMRSLGTLPGGQRSNAHAINKHGHVAGASHIAPDDEPGGSDEHAFLYQHGVMRDLGTLGGESSVALAINDAGQVPGFSGIDPANPEREHAFLYTAGTMRDIGTVTPGSSSRANGINNHGQVVGWYTTGTGRSFVYDARRGMRDLNRLVDPASGWFIHAGYSINDRGQIVALGCKNGQYGAVLLTPHKGHDPAAAPADADADADAAHDPAAPVDVNPPCQYG